jgi:hypothetical protein
MYEDGDGAMSVDESLITVIDEPKLRAYSVNFDIDDNGNSFYNLEGFVDVLMFELVDFAYGGSEFWESSAPKNPVDAVTQAAKALYRIPEIKKVKDLYDAGGEVEDDEVDQLLRKGEFGEFILFHLLRNYNDAVPLISKIYFKDADGVPVHGFDAVHYHESTNSLWLGESKCYKDGKAGIKALIVDIKQHIKNDYLKREFALIGKKFQYATSEEPQRLRILSLLNSQNTMATKIGSITIPVLCTFNCKTVEEFNEASQEYIDALTTELRLLEDFFQLHNDHPLKDKLNIILLLMPLRSKRDFVMALHERIEKAKDLIA